jgi:site-specific recombinase XerD
MSPESEQREFKLALKQDGLVKTARPQTLPHYYPTQLWERGVSRPVIQSYLVHSSPRTTMIYTHLSDRVEIDARQAIYELMGQLP